MIVCWMEGRWACFTSCQALNILGLDGNGTVLTHSYTSRIKSTDLAVKDVLFGTIPY